VIGTIAYGLSVFIGTAVLGFVVAPFIAFESGLFPIQSDAEAVFSFLTLRAFPLLFGLSVGAALSYEWASALSRFRRVAAYLGTVLIAWILGAAFAVWALG